MREPLEILPLTAEEVEARGLIWYSHTPLG